MKKLSIILLLCVLLAACTPIPGGGTITEKIYTPAHTDVTFIWLPCGDGLCMQPYLQHYSDRWAFVVEDTTVSVPAELYDRLQVGDEFQPWMLEENE